MDGPFRTRRRLSRLLSERCAGLAAGAERGAYAHGAPLHVSNREGWEASPWVAFREVYDLTFLQWNLDISNFRVFMSARCTESHHSYAGNSLLNG